MAGRVMAALAAAAAAAVFAAPALAQVETLLDETNTIVAPAAPSAVLREFDIAAAGSYELRVTDLGVPAALGNVRAAVLRDGAIVRELALTGANGVATFDATAGAYSLSIVGTPASQGIGTVGALVRRGSDAPVLEVAETIEIPNPPPPATRTQLDTTFRIVDAGAYTVSLSDLGFPVTLASARLSIVRTGGGALDAQLAAPGSATFNAVAADYRLFVIADAAAPVEAGVAHVAVASTAGGAPVYRRTLPVGRVDTLGGAALTAGQHTLAAADLKLPADLGSLALGLTLDGALVARLDAPGSLDFTAATGGHDLLAVARAAPGTSGSFATELRKAGGPVLSLVGSASDGDAAGATTLSGSAATAGTYRLRLTDFAFPQGFSSLRATVTQNGLIVATLATPGTLDVSLQAGAVKVLVFGVANTAGNGIYGVELAPAGGGANVIEGTRGVGSAFDAWQFAVPAAGRYRVIADDLEFPQRFARLDAVITRGSEVVGSFFGGGSFIFSATPGNYFINFIAKPGAQSGGAGTYRMRVATAPSLPTVTFAASPATVVVGTATQLTWSSTDATQCVATGAWNGSKAASGTETTATLSSQTTFTLDCTGPGGTANKQVTVGVSQPGASGGGSGGGAMSETLLLCLLAAAALRARASPRRF
jgi:hypothetical protein